MKTYTFEVTVEEGCDEFWESITTGGNSGCDEVRKEILDKLTWAGFECAVRLVAYSDDL